MNNFLRFLTLSAVVLLTTALSANQKDQAMLEESIQLLKNNYINPLHVNLKAFYAQAKLDLVKMCPNSCSRDEAERKIAEIISKIHDPHLNLTPQLRFDEDKPYSVGAWKNTYRYGFRAIESEDNGVITFVQPETPAEMAGLQVGDTLISVESDKDLYVLDSLLEKIAHLEAQTRIIDIKIRSAKGDERIVRMKPDYLHWKPKLKIIDSNVAKITIPDFYDTDISDMLFHSFIKKITSQKITKLIIDLRFNEGGNPFTVINIAGVFAKNKVGHIFKDIKNATIKYWYDRGYTFYRDSLKPEDDDKLPFQNYATWSNSVVVLIGKNTFSGGENLADLVHGLPNVMLLGEETLGGGGVLGNRFTLTTGAGLNITTHRIYRIDNSLVPFKVIPDQKVALDPDALVKGHDTQLEAAIEYLNKTK
jgi:C-terminal processing protease CtpA/Prc